MTAVQDLNPNSNPPQDVSTFETVTNPFLDSHSATLGLGSATTSYDSSWSNENASFLIDVSHVVPDAGAALYRGLSEGTMSFSVSTDTLVHLTGTYSYSLPRPAMDTICGLFITDLQPLHSVLSASGQADTFTTPSGSGTLSLDQSAVLQAGHNYFMRYSIYVAARGNSGVLATGDGFLHLTFEPVPEPTTLGLIGITAILCCRRR